MAHRPVGQPPLQLPGQVGPQQREPEVQRSQIGATIPVPAVMLGSENEALDEAAQGGRHQMPRGRREESGAAGQVGHSPGAPGGEPSRGSDLLTHAQGGRVPDYFCACRLQPAALRRLGRLADCQADTLRPARSQLSQCANEVPAGRRLRQGEGADPGDGVDPGPASGATDRAGHPSASQAVRGSLIFTQRHLEWVRRRYVNKPEFAK